VRRVKNGRQKPSYICKRHFSRERQRVFLSQAGPRFDLVLLKLGITSRLVVEWLPSETKKATRWVALVWLAMRLGD
jgi:hypothetical protein